MNITSNTPPMTNIEARLMELDSEARDLVADINYYADHGQEDFAEHMFGELLKLYEEMHTLSSQEV